MVTVVGELALDDDELPLSDDELPLSDDDEVVLDDVPELLWVEARRGAELAVAAVWAPMEPVV